LADRTLAVSLAPDSAIAWSARGNALFLLDRFAEALPDLRKALALDPQNTELATLIAKAEEHLKPPTPTAARSPKRRLRQRPARIAPPAAAIVITPGPAIVSGAPAVPATGAGPEARDTGAASGRTADRPVVVTPVRRLSRVRRRPATGGSAARRAATNQTTPGQTRCH
jgi:tetratricopeptide (TPR) repeat protein